MDTLFDMLRYRRPARSNTEQEFITKFIEPLGTTEDSFGNHYLTVGDSPTTLFSCHTDTVHKNDGMQQVYISDNQIHTDNDVLGADCGTGVWIMMQMIEAGVNGLYIFHRDEEIGGKGSSFIADHTPELLDGISRAIAFDRMGNNEVITQQFSGMCCSDEFADDLSEKLGMNYHASPLGSFTDTANYTQIIPECTNVGVGYMHQHTASEYQEVSHLENLIAALINVDWNSLPTVRDTADTGNDLWFDDGKYAGYTEYASDLELSQLVYEDPEAAIELLLTMGLTSSEVSMYRTKAAA